MREVSQALWGVLAAILSAAIVFGGLALSLAESGVSRALLPTDTPFTIQPVATQQPGEPTFTPSPTSPPTPTPTEPKFERQCDYPPDWVIVTVEVGDTLESLALKYNVSVDELRKGNCWDYDRLLPGMNLYVPAPPTETPLPSNTPVRETRPTRTPMVYCSPPYGWIIYIVRPGDTLYKIALAHFTTYQELMRRNCLQSTTIRVGQRLYVPYVPPSSTPPPYYTPTLPPPVATSTPFVPTATRIIPTRTPIIPTATPIVATETSVPLPTQTNPPPTWTNTPLPPTFTPTQEPSPTPTPIPDTPTAPPLPTSTYTPIPLPTNTTEPPASPTVILTEPSPAP